MCVCLGDETCECLGDVDGCGINSEWVGVVPLILEDVGGGHQLMSFPPI